ARAPAQDQHDGRGPQAQAQEAAQLTAIVERYRHLASAPLLTREGEVAIARRIERGERRVLRALLDAPIAAGDPPARSHRARLRASPAARREAIARLRARSLELERADTELRDCEHRAGMPAAAIGRLLGGVRRSGVEALKVARQLGLTRADLEELALKISGSRRSIAAIEREGGRSAAAQRAVFRELSDATRSADDARGEMFRANVRLVATVAWRYRDRGVSYGDLIQEGSIGLMKGIERFDHRRGFKLCTYASWWIRVAMSRAVADQPRTIRIPPNVH